MSKTTLKYLVTALLFVDLCSIAFLGLLLAFVIPSGPGGPYGAKFFLGLHRHAWVDIHLTLAIILLGLVVLHIWLSWEWVVGVTKKFFGEQWQRVLWVLSGAWFVVLFAAWIIVRFG